MGLQHSYHAPHGGADFLGLRKTRQGSTEIDYDDGVARRMIWRELRVALLNGATVAVLIGVAVALLFTPQLGGVIAAAMLINIIVAGLAGVAVPVIFERLDQDPAVASSVFVTMITDSMGFLAFLGLAVASGLAG